MLEEKKLNFNRKLLETAGIEAEMIDKILETVPKNGYVLHISPLIAYNFITNDNNHFFELYKEATFEEKLYLEGILSQARRWRESIDEVNKIKKISSNFTDRIS